jgi:hypothetical protein
MDLYRFEARMYDPVIGRWTSLDPAQQFFNNYIAMSSDPANHVDLDGRWSWACFTEGFAGLNKSGAFNGIGDMLSVYSAAKSIQSLSQVSDASINLGMSTALTNAKAVLNQVATAMAGGGVGDGVSGLTKNTEQNEVNDKPKRPKSKRKKIKEAEEACAWYLKPAKEHKVKEQPKILVIELTYRNTDRWTVIVSDDDAPTDKIKRTKKGGDITIRNYDDYFERDELM